jgi:hypothetical protein
MLRPPSLGVSAALRPATGDWAAAGNPAAASASDIMMANAAQVLIIEPPFLVRIP